MTIEIDESERQFILLALAELELSRPGWHDMIAVAVPKFGGENAETMFNNFKTTSGDRVKETHKPLGPSFMADYHT